MAHFADVKMEFAYSLSAGACFISLVASINKMICFN